MQISHRQHMQSVNAIFDVEDRYARERGIRGIHPRPIGGVRYFLMGEVNGGVRSFYSRPSELLTVRTPGGYQLFFDQLRYTDAQAYRMEIEAGTYIIRIESEFYQVSERELDLPESATPLAIDLEPGYLYPFPQSTLPNVASPTLLRGTLHAVAGDGVEDVSIEVIGKSNRYLTDATGQWVLVFNDAQDTEDVTVRFEPSAGPIEEVGLVPVEKGQMRTLTQAGLRGWVQNNAGVAIPKVRVTVSGRVQEITTASDGSWFYYFDINQGAELVSVSARLPDGSLLTQENIQVQARAMVVVPTFKFA